MNVPQSTARICVSYQVWIPICRMWDNAQFVTTRDAIHGHFAALRLRMHAGQVRAIKVKHLH